ncbi:right-handed parallel beta-helix repeat-containing protein [soil metagenome]
MIGESHYEVTINLNKGTPYLLLLKINILVIPPRQRVSAPSISIPMLSYIILFLACSSLAYSATWHVSPSGDDKAPGSLEQPFATIQRAQESAASGDTVFVRGGTYQVKESQIALRKDDKACVTVLDKSGMPGSPITYCAYREEKPVFDYSDVKPEGVRIDAFHITGSWLHLQGLEVTGVQATLKTHSQSICFENDGSHNIYERLSMHDGQAIGIYSVRGSDNLFLNCDAWNNWDYTSEDGKGGNVDGFGCHPTKGSTGNIFRGCRAWFNSDDGYDCITSHESVTFENCWALYNGLSPQKKSLGDGNGFKAGGYGTMAAERMPDPAPRHRVVGCLAVGNKSYGFYANHHPTGSDWFNNTAYRNKANFNMLCRLRDNVTDVDGFGHKLHNNLSYKSGADILRFDPARCESSHNSFTLGLTFTDKDFISVDEAELLKPRQANGDLPIVTFLHPVEGSVLIDAGVEVGPPFKGAKHDIGAFEQ